MTRGGGPAHAAPHPRVRPTCEKPRGLRGFGQTARDCVFSSERAPSRAQERVAQREVPREGGVRGRPGEPAAEGLEGPGTHPINPTASFHHVHFPFATAPGPGLPPPSPPRPTPPHLRGAWVGPPGPPLRSRPVTHNGRWRRSPLPNQRVSPKVGSVSLGRRIRSPPRRAPGVKYRYFAESRTTRSGRGGGGGGSRGGAPSGRRRPETKTPPPGPRENKPPKNKSRGGECRGVGWGGVRGEAKGLDARRSLLFAAGRWGSRPGAPLSYARTAPRGVIWPRALSRRRWVAGWDVNRVVH